MKGVHVTVGPSVEVYPRSSFSKLPKGIKIEDLWRLIGPTVHMNFERLPLWQVFCICYFEGLSHGMAATEQRLNPQTNESQQLKLL